MLGIEERLRQYEPLFGEWYIRREIGSGGFGRVYCAEYRDAFGGVYTSAIKAIEIIPDASVVKTEAEILDMAKNAYISEIGTLETLHGVSYIMQIHDHDIKEIRENGQVIGYDLIIRMELLDNLNDLLRKKEEEILQPEEIFRLAKQLTCALASCHGANIMHRDINPSNIFRNAFGEYKLGDFGIAKQMIGTMRAETAIGTKQYVAPEVYARAGLTPDSGARYDVTADIYSLGLVLYQLTNDNYLPFFYQGMPLAERSRAVDRRLAGEALPMPLYAGSAFGSIILKACAFQPADRYSSAQKMLDALETLAHPQEESCTQRIERPAAVQDGMSYWHPPTAYPNSILGLLCLSDAPTPEMTYLAEVFSGQRIRYSASRTKKEAPTGVLTPRMASHLPAWSLRVPWMPYNRLVVSGYSSVGERAFCERKDLVSVQCMNSVKEISSEAFLRCINVKEVLCASGLEHIGMSAFAQCSKLQRCHLPNTVQTLDSKVFLQCTSLRSLNIPDGTQSLGDQFCDGCTSLHQAVLPSTLRRLGAAAFRNSGLEKILMPDRCVELGERLFEGCCLMKSVQLSLRLKSIPQHCFAGCTTLSQIDLPFSLKEIGEKAFFGCSALKQIVIPEGVERIGAQAFAGCTRLTTIRVPISVQFIGDGALELTSGKSLLKKSKVIVLARRDSYAWQYCRQFGIRVREG